jgi:hypothetical protein
MPTPALEIPFPVPFSSVAPPRLLQTAGARTIATVRPEIPVMKKLRALNKLQVDDLPRRVF